MLQSRGVHDLSHLTNLTRLEEVFDGFRVHVADLTLSTILVASSLTLKSQQSTKSLVLFRSTILVAVLTSLVHRITLVVYLSGNHPFAFLLLCSFHISTIDITSQSCGSASASAFASPIRFGNSAW
ncbi:hypothetical protein E2542_SST15916 [Spatholobus suberectus]|nr:hypothetical protein E2542_SST15916 [Spatholobus suberectus]